MSPSKRRSSKRPYGEQHRPLDMDRLGSMPHGENGPGNQRYTVANIRAGQKEYVCPGCNQIIEVGTPHVVAWLSEPAWGFESVEGRRHWHSNCWRRKLRP